jgi:hypothetical protein
MLCHRDARLQSGTSQWGGSEQLLISAASIHWGRCSAVEIPDYSLRRLRGPGHHMYSYQRIGYVEIDVAPLRCSIPIRCLSMGRQRTCAHISHWIKSSQHQSGEIQRSKTSYLNGDGSEHVLISAGFSTLKSRLNHREVRDPNRTSQWEDGKRVLMSASSSNFPQHKSSEI